MGHYRQLSSHDNIYNITQYKNPEEVYSMYFGPKFLVSYYTKTGDLVQIISSELTESEKLYITHKIKKSI